MMENAPFFVGAVLAGNMARLSAGMFVPVLSIAMLLVYALMLATRYDE